MSTGRVAPNWLRLARLSLEVQKCIGEHKREFTCKPRAHPDPHVLSMSWQACPFHLLGPFHFFWGGGLLFTAVPGNEQMRQEITVSGTLLKIWFRKCSCKISSKLRNYFEKISCSYGYRSGQGSTKNTILHM